MKRAINEKPPTHWTLNSLNDKGFAFASDDAGNRVFLPVTVVEEAGITEDDVGRGFRAYAFAAATHGHNPRGNEVFPQITTPIWWDSDQALAISEHMPPEARAELLALLKRIDADLDRIYDLTGVDAAEEDETHGA